MDMIMEYVWAGIVGGALCVIAQILIDKTKLTPARILVCYVVSGVILHAVGVYEKIISFGSMGAKVPLTGFGYCLAEGVKKAVDEKGLFGAITGGLTGAAAGITAAILFSYLFSLFFTSRDT